MAQEIKSGTLVKLKSGGPTMTTGKYRRVGNVSTSFIECSWFDKADKRLSEYFHEDQLEIKAGS